MEGVQGSVNSPISFQIGPHSSNFTIYHVYISKRAEHLGVLTLLP